MSKLTRRVAVAAAVAAFAVAGAATPAAAIPPAGPNQSVTFTYYADRFKTEEVGGWSYGNCGEPFDYGVHTRYYTVRIINC